MDKEFNAFREKNKSSRKNSEGTSLRKQYIEDMTFGGYSEKTIVRYTTAMVRMSKCIGKSPIYFTDEDLGEYFKYLKEGRKLASQSLAAEHAALNFFYKITYPRDLRFVKLYKARLSNKIPAVLSVGEVRRILSHVTNTRCHACLALIYSCGLRISEAVTLRVGDVDSVRMLIHIRLGKGEKDRYVPLPKKTLKVLRESWKTHRNPVWLFPSRNRRRLNRKGKKSQNSHISIPTISSALKQAALEGGCHKKISAHTFRHSYATNLLEEGVPLHVIQSNLGHKCLSSTGIYTHMTDKFHREAVEKLDSLIDGVLQA